MTTLVDEIKDGRKNLRGANLRGADLRGADLRGADLRGADLCDTNFDGATITYRGISIIVRFEKKEDPR